MVGKISLFLKTKSWWWKTGLILAIIHFFFIGLFVVEIGTGGADAQWQLVWILPDYIDFPVSILMWQIKAVVPDAHFYYDFCDLFCFPPAPLGDLRDFIIPATFYLIIGTAWYFYLPRLIERIAGKIAVDRIGYLCITLLFIIPIISKWSEEIVLYLDDLPPAFTSKICGLWCFLWVGFFAWLLLGHSKKTRAMWLLFLGIFVFYQFFKETYMYFKFIR
jgi:hypothetical protein